jgi:hypothetical protein
MSTSVSGRGIYDLDRLTVASGERGDDPTTTFSEPQLPVNAVNHIATNGFVYRRRSGAGVEPTERGAAKPHRF